MHTNATCPSTSRLLRSGFLSAVAAITAVSLAACNVQGGSGSGTSNGGDAFPAKSIELTAPSSAGGSTDLISRALAKTAEKPFGQSVVVVNKPGANGAVGGKEVLSSRPDGYKMVLMPQSLFAIGPLLKQDSSAIDLANMTYLAGLTVEDYVMVVPASSPVKTVSDLVKAAPITYGTTGAGTGSQLAQTLLFASAKAKATDVPLDGGAGMITALLGKQVDVGVSQVAEAASQIKAGKLRPIATFSEQRIGFLPDVATAKEQGFDIVVNQRRWLAAPKGLPDDVLASLRKGITAATQDPSYDRFLKDNYIGRWDVQPDQVKTEVESARDRYAALAKTFNVDLAS
jgi:tripartite-type tricarboxylate transporter receptor subunit TctC